MTPVRLLVVDDHTLFRRGLIALLSQDDRFTVSGQAGDIGEALRCLQHSPPDLILLDNHLPGVLGVDGIAALKDAAPGTRILMLTVSENADDLAAALHAGADGYLLKTVELDHLSEFIIKVLAGESVVSPEMMTKLVTAFRGKPAPPPPSSAVAGALDPCPAPSAPAGLALLSAREREVLNLVALGDSNKVIARKLDIAETTVKIHVQHILRKLQLSSRVHAAVYAAGQEPF
ncbi:two component transcriptional regulator, LuxR family [Polaromonas sp. OV174]|uniref:response regulator n=1 Tax=Polaromonas sp. OV174 TaxID=1855300 RepID=UPI0008E6E130|nr:response regulator [Polaromonas sp. OV174]SFC20534.1 two component transcriptional regulator, LuxR family [Polaromonas sp. OV174]